MENYQLHNGEQTETCRNAVVEQNFTACPENYFSVSTEAGYIIDFQRQCFSYIANHNLFLCGHSRDEAMEQAYDFYSQIVYEDDLALFPKIIDAILNSDCITERPEDIEYFSFTLRFKINSQYTEKPYYLMVIHRLRPVFFDGKPALGICMMNISVMKTSGNLRVYFKGDRYAFDKYSFVSRKWSKEQGEHLTEQEIKILRLFKEGIDNQTVADELQIKRKTLYCKHTSICKKLNVDTIEQAVVYVTNHLMLFDTNREAPVKNKSKTEDKKHYQKLTPEKMEHIQECLDNGQSVNSIAKKEEVSRGAIRNDIDSGKLVIKHKKP
jgi:DNA-binding NarL/FixJ family response regulator